MRLFRFRFPPVLAGLLAASFLFHASAAEPAKPKNGPAAKKGGDAKTPGLPTRRLVETCVTCYSAYLNRQ